jgi:hypothetical protein
MNKDNNIYDRPRQALVKAIAKSPHQLTLKDLSLALGRNHAYLQQYLERRSPARLPEDVRYQLAKMLDIPHQSLMPTQLKKHMLKTLTDINSYGVINIPVIDHPAHADIPQQSWSISYSIIARHVTGKTNHLGLALSGDNAITPVISCDDYIIIDTADIHPTKAGIFAIDMDDHIRFRFLDQPDANEDQLFVRYSSSSDGGFTHPLSSLKIMGRAIWKFCLI